jgi:hypothetical protein
VIVCTSENQAKEALTLVQHVLEQELGLQLSSEKTRINYYDHADGSPVIDVAGNEVNDKGQPYRRTCKVNSPRSNGSSVTPPGTSGTVISWLKFPMGGPD